MTGMAREYFYRCEKCGGIFEEAEIDKEPRGDQTSHWTCPDCGDDELTEVTECQDCGGWFEKTYGSYGYELCPDCLKKRMTPENAVRFGHTDREYEIHISGFFGLWYDEKQIEDILLRHIKDYYPQESINREAVNYCDADPSEFAYMMEGDDDE